MNFTKLVIILAITVVILYLLKKDAQKGLAAATFSLILMPRELFFQVSESVPTLTGYRAIILVVFMYLLFTGKLNIKWQNMPIGVLLSLVLLTKLCSLIFALNFSLCFNGFLIFVLERYLFFIILIKAIESRIELGRYIHIVAIAITIIAILGSIERYTHFNPVDYITLSDNSRLDARMAFEIYSTLPHPILYGVALAMGLPICLYVFDTVNNPHMKYLVGLCVLIIVANIYFSNSRGPWLACILVVLVLISFNYSRISVRMIPAALLVALVLLSRPGVFTTIYGLSSSTFDESSLEGGSFQYRFELFRVAFREINLAPERMAFGYGDNTAQSMNLTGTLSYGSHREVSFWSWDNEFALILLHNGIIGFIMHLVLFFYCLIFLIKHISILRGNDKQLLIALLASNTVFIFMMTNVAIFAPQLHFIFWTNMAVAVILVRDQYRLLVDDNEHLYLYFRNKLYSVST